jgi:cation transport ATPase
VLRNGREKEEEEEEEEEEEKEEEERRKAQQSAEAPRLLVLFFFAFYYILIQLRGTPKLVSRHQHLPKPHAKPKPLQTPDESRIPFAPFFLSFSLSAFSFPLAFSLLGFSLLLAVCWHMWLFESHVASSLWSFSILFSFLFSLLFFLINCAH